VQLPGHLKEFVVGDAGFVSAGIEMLSTPRSGVDWATKHAKRSAEGLRARYAKEAEACSLRNGIFPDLVKGLYLQGAYGVGCVHPFATKEELLELSVCYSMPKRFLPGRMARSNRS
jgi:hypothetical protein